MPSDLPGGGAAREVAPLTIGELYESLGPNGSTVIDGWRISRHDDEIDPKESRDDRR